MVMTCTEAIAGPPQDDESKWTLSSRRRPDLGSGGILNNLAPRFGNGAATGVVAAGRSVRQVEFLQERAKSRVLVHVLHQGVYFHSAQMATTSDVRPV